MSYAPVFADSHSLTLRERLSVSLHHKAQLLRREKAWGHHSTGSEAEVLELDYQGHFQATRSARNPATILQSDLLGFATPVTKMEILVTGPRH